ncbi:MAG: disulfide reductase [Deltaproteobacteria bacterium]|nr:MAG: disulfide reductase [Deltaproteobacteria bacterium]
MNELIRKVSYYPGCSLRGTARDYAESVEAVCPMLGVELEELEDWNCCGATAAHSLNKRIAINLAGRNVRIAEEIGKDVVVPCPLCFNRLKTAQKELTSERKGLYDVKIQGGKITIWDLASFLAQEEILKFMAEKVIHPLSGLRAVCYYGCMASRPPAITGEKHYEDPTSMDRILEKLGVTVLPWSHKTDCCGASHVVARPDVVSILVGRLFKKAFAAGANCIVVSCQMCHANLDLYQERIMAEQGLTGKLPVLYFTELIGLALGHKDAKKWLKMHFVDPIGLMEECCNLSLA